MRQAEIFEGADFGKPRVSLARARELVGAVEALEEYDGSDLWGHCERLATRARASGAHSVARAVCWYGCTHAFDRHGPEPDIPVWIDYRNLQVREALPDEESMWPGVQKAGKR